MNDILINLLIVVEIIVSILLILVILVQPSKSGGLGGALGGGMGEQLFGARTGNVLTKATIILASVFLINTLLLTLLYGVGRSERLPDPVATGLNNAEPSGEVVEIPAGEIPTGDLEAEAPTEAPAEAPAEVPAEAPVTAPETDPVPGT